MSSMEGFFTCQGNLLKHMFSLASMEIQKGNTTMPAEITAREVEAKGWGKILSLLPCLSGGVLFLFSLLKMSSSSMISTVCCDPLLSAGLQTEFQMIWGSSLLLP